MNKKILVVAAHPDDEILGAGGTLRKYVEEGYAVYCLILGQGCLSREKSCQDDLKHLHNECMKAGEIIGFKEIYFPPANWIKSIDIDFLATFRIEENRN